MDVLFLVGFALATYMAFVLDAFLVTRAPKQPPAPRPEISEEEEWELLYANPRTWTEDNEHHS